MFLITRCDCPEAGIKESYGSLSPESETKGLKKGLVVESNLYRVGGDSESQEFLLYSFNCSLNTEIGGLSGDSGFIRVLTVLGLPRC